MLILDANAGSGSLVATLASASNGYVVETRLIDSRVWGSSLLVSKGSGTLNYLPRWSNIAAGSVALGDSQIVDNGVCVAVGSSAVSSDVGSGTELAPALWVTPPSVSPGRWSFVGGLMGSIPSFTASQSTWGSSANILTKWKARGGLLTVSTNNAGVTLVESEAVVNGVPSSSVNSEAQTQMGAYSIVTSSVVASGVVVTYDFDTYLSGTVYKKLHSRPSSLEQFRPVVSWYPSGVGAPTNIKVTVSYSSDGTATNSTVFTDVVIFDGAPQFKGQYLWVGPNSVVGNSSNAWIRRVKFEFTLPTTTAAGEQARINFIGLLSNLEQFLDRPNTLSRNRWNADQVFVNSSGIRFEPSGSTGPWDSKVLIDASSNNLRLNAALSGGKVVLGWDKSGTATSVVAGAYESSAHRFRPFSLTEDVQLGDSTYRWNGLFSKGVIDVQRSVGGTFASFSAGGAYPTVVLYDAGILLGGGSASSDTSLYRSGIGGLKTDGTLEALGNIKGPTFQSTTATGTAPLTVASTTLVTNLNADRLDGQDGSYYEGRDATAFTSTVAGLTLTRAAGNLVTLIDDSLSFPNTEGNSSSSILGAFLNNALVNCVSQQGATLTTSVTGGVSLSSASSAFTPSSPGIRDYCQIQTTNGGTAVFQITGLTLQTAAHGFWESFVILRYPDYATRISNLLIEIRDSTGAWVTWHNSAGTWRNGIARTGHTALTNYPPNGVRFTFTFNAVATIYIAELGVWHRNYVPGRHHFAELSFGNKFTAQNRFVGTLVVDSSNFGAITGSTQFLVGSEMQSNAGSLAQVGGELRVGSLITHGAIKPNADNSTDLGASAQRFGTVYAYNIVAASSVTVAGSSLASQSWVDSGYYPRSGGQLTGTAELHFGTPRLAFYDTLSNANSRRFDFIVSNSEFLLKSYNDSYSISDTFIRAVNYNGGASLLELTASQVFVNGSLIATESWVNGLGFTTQSWVTAQGYATQTWVTNQGYATQSWVTSQNYATQSWSNSAFAPLSHTHTRSAITDFGHASTHASGAVDALPWTTIHARGTTAGRPAASASNAGYIYSNTTTGTLQWSDGSSWIDIAITSAGGTGTVTSVALTAPAELFSVSGSPISSSGTLSLSFATKAQNLVFAAPSSGSGLPSFRSLVASDIPSLSYLPLSGGTVTGDTTFSTAITVRASSAGSAATHVAVFTSSPSVSASSLVSRDVNQFRSDIGADNASNLSSGTVPSARLSGSYSSITAVGTLGSLTVSGTLTCSNLGTTNQTVGHVICKQGTSNQLFPATNSWFKGWLDIQQSDVSGLTTALNGKVPEPTSDGYWVRRKNSGTYTWETVSSFTEPSSDGLYGRRKSGSSYSWESVPALPAAPSSAGAYALVYESGSLSWRKLIGDGINL